MSRWRKNVLAEPVIAPYNRPHSLMATAAFDRPALEACQFPEQINSVSW
jgi:hypothetical protein